MNLQKLKNDIRNFSEDMHIEPFRTAWLLIMGTLFGMLLMLGVGMLSGKW